MPPFVFFAQIAEDLRNPAVILGTRLRQRHLLQCVLGAVLQRKVERGVGLVEAQPDEHPFLAVIAQKVDGFTREERPEGIFIVEPLILGIGRPRISRSGQGIGIQPLARRSPERLPDGLEAYVRRRFPRRIRRQVDVVILGVDAVVEAMLQLAVEVHLADRRCPDAARPDLIGNGDLFFGKRRLQQGDTRSVGILAGDDRLARHRADRTVGESVLKPGTLRGQPIDIGRADHRIAVRSHGVCGMIVRADEQHVAQRFGGGPGAGE
jgi:hypothetical protein